MFKTFKVLKVKKENHKVKSIFLDSELEARPGQFVMVWLPGVDEKPFSVAGTNPLRICAANVGPVTSKLCSLKEGDLLGVRGPYGNGFSTNGGKILLVGGGCGCIPLLFLAKKAAGMDVTAVLGAATAEDIILKNEFLELGKTVICTDDGSAGEKGTAPELVEKLLKKEKFDCIYACGKEMMLVKMAEIANTLRVDMQASLERYFKCGIGVCGHCSIDGRLVCRDGPVFSLQEMNKMREFGKTKRGPSGGKICLS